MAWNGPGKLTFIDDRMNADIYTDILKENLEPSAQLLRLNDDFIFQHDNDLKHTAKKTKEYLSQKQVNILEWPAQSPDLNPIKHLCAILDRKIGDRSFRKKEELKRAVEKAWAEISQAETQKLLESMKSRLKEVILAKGGPTKY